MSKPPKPSKRERREASIRKAIARVGEANRAGVGYVDALRANDGTKQSARLIYVIALRHADRLVGGKPFKDVAPAEWLRVMTAFREQVHSHTGKKVSQRTAHLKSVMVRLHLKELLQVDDLPRELNRASHHYSFLKPQYGHWIWLACLDLDEEAPWEIARQRGIHEARNVPAKLPSLLQPASLFHKSPSGFPQPAREGACGTQDVGGGCVPKAP